MRTSLMSVGPLVAAVVAAAEQREAASGCEAVVKSITGVFQSDRVRRIYEDFVLGRSLALLGSCYKGESGTR
jgi:hypothetical protein